MYRASPTARTPRIINNSSAIIDGPARIYVSDCALHVDIDRSTVVSKAFRRAPLNPPSRARSPLYDSSPSNEDYLQSKQRLLIRYASFHSNPLWNFVR